MRNNRVLNNLDISGSLRVTGSSTLDGNVTLGDNISDIIYVSGTLLNSGGASLTGSFSGSGALLNNLTASNINNFTSDVRAQHSAGANLNYVTGTYALKDDITVNSVTASVISGTTASFTNLTASNLFVTDKASINTYIQMLPVNLQNIPTNLSASYIYTSGSTNDMYFTQYQGPYTNTTRLRWLEGLMSTGLLKGGNLSTTNGTTTFNMAAGSGLIMSPNASLTSDPYPTLKYVEWTASSGISLVHSGTVPITYVSIDSNGEVIQEVHPPHLADYKTAVYLGRILHQSASVTNGAISNPATAYGVSANTLDFIRSFGPLKINGHYLAPSGSTLSLTKTSGDSYAEGRNYSTDQRNPNVVLAAQDVALTGSKIFRQYMSGSTPVILTNNNAGYTTIDPTKYQNGTGLSSVPNKSYTVQRVYWFPKAVNATLYVYYGQATYASLIDAVAGITEENFTEGENTQTSAILVGYIVVKNNASDLTNTNDAKIVQAGLCRGGIGGSGGTVGAGASYLYQLNDVQIGTPTAGEALIYDYGLGKWIDGTPANSLQLGGVDASSYALKTDVTGALTPYATLSGVSSSFTTPSQVSGAITSSLTNYPVRTEVSGAITSSLVPYATLTGVSASFTTPSQVSSSITGALIPYAKSADVSSSFGLKTDLTSSYARLVANNVFSGSQTISGSVFVTSSIGIVLPGTLEPLITKAYDPFTSGAKVGAGRWGVFMENNALVAGFPNTTGKFFHIGAFNANSTYSQLATFSTTANTMSVPTYFSSGITGSLAGTASLATNATNAYSASFYNQLLGTLTYYVDATTGSDSNAGSAAFPFRTIQKAVDTIPILSQYGAIIYINSGSYEENVRLSGKYISNTAQLGATVTLRAIGVSTSASLLDIDPILYCDFQYSGSNYGEYLFGAKGVKFTTATYGINDLCGKFLRIYSGSNTSAYFDTVIESNSGSYVYFMAAEINGGNTTYYKYVQAGSKVDIIENNVNVKQITYPYYSGMDSETYYQIKYLNVTGNLGYLDYSGGQSNIYSKTEYCKIVSNGIGNSAYGYCFITSSTGFGIYSNYAGLSFSSCVIKNPGIPTLANTSVDFAYSSYESIGPTTQLVFNNCTITSGFQKTKNVRLTIDKLSSYKSMQNVVLANPTGSVLPYHENTYFSIWGNSQANFRGGGVFKSTYTYWFEVLDKSSLFIEYPADYYFTGSAAGTLLYSDNSNIVFGNGYSGSVHVNIYNASTTPILQVINGGLLNFPVKPYQGVSFNTAGEGVRVDSVNYKWEQLPVANVGRSQAYYQTSASLGYQAYTAIGTNADKTIFIVSGSQVIENNTTSTADILRITNKGTGNSILVEDSANPDSTPFIVKNDGKVGIGTTTPTTNLDVIGSQFINGNLYMTSSLGVVLNNADSPLITRGWDAFTSGVKSGIGRWGMFMEANALVAGIPNLTSKNFKIGAYNADSTFVDLATFSTASNTIVKPTTFSNGVTGSFSGSGAGLYNVPASAFDLSAYATLVGVSASFTTPAQVSGAITGALTPYAQSADVSSSFGLKSDLTASYARLTASNNFTGINTFTTVTASTGVSASYLYGDGSGLTNLPAPNLSAYATLVGVSASFTTPTQVSGAITSSLTNYAVRAEISGAITGATSNFPTKVEVTGALIPYAQSANISSSFGLKTDLTASYARLGANNTFTAAQNIFNNDVVINGTASIAYLNNINQQSLFVGDKYITIMSGSSTHVQLDGAGLLFGSGSSDPTTGDQSSIAHIVYRKGNAPTDFTSDYIEIYPGLRVSGSLTASAASNFTQVTASSGVSASFFYGNGSNLTNLPLQDLSTYAKSTDVSSSFGLKTDLTASYARLAVSNTFTQPNTFTQVTASTGFSGGSFNGTTVSASSTLQAGGQSTFGAGIKLAITSKTANYSLTASSDYIVAFSGSSLTGTLPNAAGTQGTAFIIKNLHTSSVFVTSSTANIDGSTAGISIYGRYTSYTFVSDGTNWLIV